MIDTWYGISTKPGCRAQLAYLNDGLDRVAAKGQVGQSFFFVSARRYPAFMGLMQRLPQLAQYKKKLTWLRERR
jgi:hypothetical protein